VNSSPLALLSCPAQLQSFAVSAVVMSVPFFAKALFEYDAVESSELSVVTGDFLTVEEVNESGWCLVRATTLRIRMHECTCDAARN
jgi:hypothetical protein